MGGAHRVPMEDFPDEDDALRTAAPRPSSDEIESIRRAIAMLEAQRQFLGNMAVDAALKPLEERLAALTSANAAAEGERRQMVVLFADISGFTSLAESADPEELASTVNELWGELDGIVLKLGGRVDKHIGDCLMALWGGRGTAENAAEMALEAALAMQVAMNGFLERGRLGGLSGDAKRGAAGLRIGVHAGPVFLGEVGSNREITAMGETVNTASRLQKLAPVGSVFASADVVGQARNLFEIEEAGCPAVRGRSADIQCYIVRKRMPRQFVDPSRGLGRDLPLVGRRKELETIREDLEKTAPGTVRRVLVRGEPGIGKSRFLREIGRQLPDGTVMARVRAFPESAGSPYRLVRDMLLGAAGITQDQAPAIALERLGSAAMGRLGERDLREALRLAGLSSLSGFECGSSGGPGLTVEFLRRVVASLAPPGRTSVMMLEDIHWADEPSLEILLGLSVPWAETGLLMLCTARPWLEERLPGLCASSFHRCLDLGPLSPEDASKMAEMVAGQSVLPGELSLLAEKAGGNPFFIEELVGAASEAASRGETFRIDDQGAPVTLRSVLQARIDQIEPSRLRVLRMGAVVGEAFWDSAVAVMTGEPVEAAAASLEKLCSEGLLTRSPVSSFSSSVEYRFRHAILRDAVYESTRLLDRRRAHSAAAAWLEKAVGRSLPAFAGVVAHHCEVAGERGRAAAMYAVAGEEALARSAYREALGFFRRGTMLAQEEKEGLRARLAFGEGCCLEKLARYEESMARLEDCLALAEAAGDLVVSSRCAATMSWVKTATGDCEASTAMMEKALDLARRSGDRASIARALSRMIPQRGSVTPEERLKPGLEAREIFREIGDSAGEAITLLNLGNIAEDEGLLEQAGSFYRSSLALYRTMGHTWGIANCIMNLGIVAKKSGDCEKALSMYGESLSLSESIGDREGIALSHLNAGNALMKLERFEEALAEFRLSASESLDTGLLPILALALGRIASVLLITGKPIRAARIAASIEASENPPEEARAEAAEVIGRAMASGSAEEMERAVRSGRQTALLDAAARETEDVVPPGRTAGLGRLPGGPQPNL